MAPFSAPVSRSMSFHRMLLGSEARLISGIRSSHSRPSLCDRREAWSLGAAPMVLGMSFMPHLGRFPAPRRDLTGTSWDRQAASALGQVPGSEDVLRVHRTYRGRTGSSFIPHFGHVPGSEDVTSGCIGQA